MGIDDARKSARARCSARNTATRCASSRMGDQSRTTATHRRLFDRALRRHACRTAPATSASSPSSARARSRPASAASRRARGDAARKTLNADAARLRAISRRCSASPPDEAAERLQALIEDKRKLERELADARKKLAMGGGAAGGAATPSATSPASSSMRARLSGVDMKDLKSPRRRGQAERRLRRRRDRRRSARTARRASSSR